MMTNFFLQLLILFFIVLIVFGFIVFYIIYTKKENLNPKKEKLPYISNYKFMTPSEISFYKQLEVAIGDKYYIVPQVQLSKIIMVDNKRTKEFYKYRSKIDKKSVDFALFTKPDFKFFKAIELNDYTHDSTKRAQRDFFVNEAMESAGLLLETVDHRESFKA